MQIDTEYYSVCLNSLLPMCAKYLVAKLFITINIPLLHDFIWPRDICSRREPGLMHVRYIFYKHTPSVICLFGILFVWKCLRVTQQPEVNMMATCEVTVKYPKLWHFSLICQRNVTPKAVVLGLSLYWGNSVGGTTLWDSFYMGYWCVSSILFLLLYM